MVENKKQLRKAILGLFLVILGVAGQYYSVNATTEIIMTILLGLGIGILFAGLFLDNRIKL
ncbi:hypothetical protein [Christiangramia sp. SM2212]|uniref:Uncharacterized protein n=1 Tax=Christiangramia sediminicola TaxID=3073267 RepID=A0ABU1EL26_9FLAO|nr:hypothetical protein [Christiangramia sp. SM2212]MDR5589085.1 hypothetical protein [Christiangramia sp. SM2212]